MSWPRALAVWLLIVAAETVHGILRQFFIAPLIGDTAARQAGVLVGSGIIFAIASAFIRWINARTFAEQFRVGLLWVMLMAGFEFGLGAALGYPPERMRSDYDPTVGGLMAFGMLFLLFAPVLAARVRGFGRPCADPHDGGRLP